MHGRRQSLIQKVPGTCFRLTSRLSTSMEPTSLTMTAIFKAPLQSESDLDRCIWLAAWRMAVPLW